jgi:hypothetical protein
MVLQDNGPHAFRPGKPGDVHRIDRSRAIVGIAVDMDVYGSGQNLCGIVSRTLRRKSGKGKGEKQHRKGRE